MAEAVGGGAVYVVVYGGPTNHWALSAATEALWGSVLPEAGVGGPCGGRGSSLWRPPPAATWERGEPDEVEGGGAARWEKGGHLVGEGGACAGYRQP